MRLFTKVFLLLLATLLITAGLSSWLGEKWRTESRIIEANIAQLSNMGRTALSVYELEGVEGYRHWIRQNMRRRHIYGRLLDSNATPLQGFGPGFGRERAGRAMPEHMKKVLEQAVHEQRLVTMIQPPLVAAALPLTGEQSNYYWIANTMLSEEEMRESGSSMRLLQLLIAIFTIAAVSTLLTRMLTQPVRSLQHTTERLGEGDLESRVEEQVTTRNDELGELGRSINSTTDRLVRLLTSHKQLLRDISHELRSPLARLQVALQLARSSASEQTNSELDRIEKEAETLNELIGEVLTLARIEQGAVELQREPLQINRIISEVLEDAAFEAESDAKSISFHAQATCQLSCDRLWITRSLDNVVRNAVRHTPAGSSVEITLQQHNGRIVIAVRDHGNGADEALLEKLFEPFVRGSEARERHAHGSGYGLGLAIAKHAVELHGGSIKAANHADGGLVVTITLPAIET